MKHITRKALLHVAVCTYIFAASTLSAMQEMPQALTAEQQKSWRFIKNAFDDSNLQPGTYNETYTKANEILTKDPTLYLTCFPYLVKYCGGLYKQELWLLKASMDYYAKHHADQPNFTKPVSAEDITRAIARVQKLQQKNEKKLEKLHKKVADLKSIQSVAMRKDRPLPSKTFEKIRKRTEHAGELPLLIQQLTSLQEAIAHRD